MLYGSLCGVIACFLQWVTASFTVAVDDLHNNDVNSVIPLFDNYVVNSIDLSRFIMLAASSRKRNVSVCLYVCLSVRFILLSLPSFF